MKIDVGMLKRMASYSTGRMLVFKPSGLGGMGAEAWPMYHMAELLVDLGYAAWDTEMSAVLRITAKGHIFLEKQSIPLSRDAAYAKQASVPDTPPNQPEKPAVDVRELSRQHPLPPARDDNG